MTMLAALYALSLRENLVEDPDLEPRRLDGVIVLSPTGELVALCPWAGGPVLGPRMPKRTNGIAPSPFFDTARYVLGCDEKGRESTAETAAAFLALVDVIDERTKDPGAHAVMEFLMRQRCFGAKDRLARGLRNDGQPFTGAEWLAFRMEGEEAGAFVHLRPAILADWRGTRALQDKAPKQRCLVTGQLAAPARLHPSLKGVPGGNPTGTTLIGFNADAFESYGLVQGDNAPCSRQAAEGVAAALNWLLGRLPERRFRGGVTIGDSVVLFWTETPHPLPELLHELVHRPYTPEEQPDVTKVSIWGRIHAAVWEESPGPDAPRDRRATPLYMLTLTGNGGRCAVRDWIETTVESAANMAMAYSFRLELAGLEDTPPLGAVVRVVTAPGATASPVLWARLLRSLLFGEPFPAVLLAQAVRRFPLESAGGRNQAILAAVLRATLNTHRPAGEEELSMALDPDVNDPAYLRGRIFAVLSTLQWKALGPVGATVTQRHFKTAMMAPQQAFPTLMALSIHHQAKAAAQKGSTYYTELLSQLVSRLPATVWPAVHTPREQALFAVGYWHQREVLFREGLAKKKEAAEKAALTHRS